MRFAVLADIHGNLPALEAVLEDVQPFHLDGMIVLGDIASRGPFPLETLQLVQSAAAHVIRGNVDEYLLDLERRCSKGEVVDGYRSAIDRWTYARIGQAGLEMFRSMPSQMVFSPQDAVPLRLVHGSAEKMNEWIILPQTLDWFTRTGIVLSGFSSPSLSHWFRNISEKYLACGHSHIPWLVEQNGYKAFNPGSAGMAINEDNRAQYALLSWNRRAWQVQFRALKYDVARTARAYQTSGLLESCGGFARAFLYTILSGCNVLGFYLLHANRLAVEKGYADYDDLPEECWVEVEKTFDWENFAGQ